MSPTLVAQNVIEIVANAETKRRTLREKHNIDAHSPIENPEYLRETQNLADPLVEFLNQLELTELKQLHVLAMLGGPARPLARGLTLSERCVPRFGAHAPWNTSTQRQQE